MYFMLGHNHSVVALYILFEDWFKCTVLLDELACFFAKSPINFEEKCSIGCEMRMRIVDNVPIEQEGIIFRHE